MSAPCLTAVPITDADRWARICRIEAARTAHAATRQSLLELAAGYEALAGVVVEVDPDDPDLQSAVADRLHALAARKKA
ncbi:MAG: hypothetical protein ACJ8F4_00120 [Sphingomonas sp.]